LGASSAAIATSPAAGTWQHRECAVAAAGEYVRARGFGLGLAASRGKQWGELLKTGCRRLHGRRRLTARAASPASRLLENAARRGPCCLVSCRLSVCWPLAPDAARAFFAAVCVGSKSESSVRHPGPGVRRGSVAVVGAYGSGETVSSDGAELARCTVLRTALNQ